MKPSDLDEWRKGIFSDPPPIPEVILKTPKGEWLLKNVTPKVTISKEVVDSSDIDVVIVDE